MNVSGRPEMLQTTRQLSCRQPNGWLLLKAAALFEPLQSTGCGPPVIATAGKDGGVRVWDPRQPDVPAAAFLPAAGPPPASSSAAGGAGAGGGGGASDCWCVAVGNSYNQMERCLLAGYQNGDIKMFDLRAARVRWESNVGKGVCGVQVRGRGPPAAGPACRTGGAAAALRRPSAPHTQTAPAATQPHRPAVPYSPGPPPARRRSLTGATSP